MQILRLVRDKWDDRFLEMAKLVASWSKDPSTQVGAVLVRPDKSVLSVGFNGLPRGIEDREELLADREYKYARIVHAELNAILAAAERPAGCTLYVWPLPPCSPCSAHIIQAGIVRVVAPAPSPARPEWLSSAKAGSDMLRQAGVECDWYSRASVGISDTPPSEPRHRSPATRDKILNGVALAAAPLAMLAYVAYLWAKQ